MTPPDIPTAAWAGAAGLVGAIGTWIVGWRNVKASIEASRAKLASETEASRAKLASDLATSEQTDRIAFRTALMAETDKLRVVVAECETERDGLKTRVHKSEADILLLKAQVEIMERWLAFFQQKYPSEANSRDPVHPEVAASGP
jgi:hypothetical protein